MADKPLVWLHGEIKTPPFSADARRSAGLLLRLVQRGVSLSMPDSRPMPGIGARCHELRVQDPQSRLSWRIVYGIDKDGVVIGEVFSKKTPKTPPNVINACERRFNLYDRAKK